MKRFLFSLFLLAAALVALFVFVVKAAPSTRLDGFGMGISTHLRFGSQAADGAFEVLRQEGIGWVAEEIPWYVVQQSPGEFQWSGGNGAWQFDFDGLQTELSNCNLHMLAVLGGGPVFLPHVYPGSPVDRDDLLDAWKAYVGAVVERYGESIDYWQIGRDVNMPAFFGSLLYPTVSAATANPDVALYGSLLQSAYEIIKAKDAGDKVILGGLEMGAADCSSNPFTFIGQLQHLGALKYADIIGLEIFRGTAWPEEGIPRGMGYDLVSGSCLQGTSRTMTLVEEIRAMRAFVSQFASKSIWITEVGYHSSEIQHLAAASTRDASQVESDLVARTIVPLLSEPYVEKIFWYTFNDEPGKPGWTFGPFGQITFSNLSALIRGGKANGLYVDAGLPAGVIEYRFMINGRSVMVLWNASAGQDMQILTLNHLQGDTAVMYPIDSVEFSTLTGTLLPVSPDGEALLQLNGRPVLVIAQSNDAIAQMKSGAQEKVDEVQDSVKSGFSSLLDDAKTAISNQMAEWLNSLKEALFQSVKQKIDDIFPK